jgi:hypothetical protein
VSKAIQNLDFQTLVDAKTIKQTFKVLGMTLKCHLILGMLPLQKLQLVTSLGENFI